MLQLRCCLAACLSAATFSTCKSCSLLWQHHTTLPITLTHAHIVYPHQRTVLLSDLLHCTSCWLCTTPNPIVALLKPCFNGYFVTIHDERMPDGPNKHSLKIQEESLLCKQTRILRWQASCWPKDKCEVVPDKQKLPLPSEPRSQTSKTDQRRPEKLTAQGALLEKALLAAVNALLEHAQELDEWDQRYTCNGQVDKGAHGPRAL